MSTPENPFGQVLVALVTPFTADGEVHWGDVEKHIDHVISHGADGIVVTGTTGETSTLTDPEKVKLVEVAKDVAAGRAKVITGGGSNETAHAIQLYKLSEKAGADAIMIVTPYYNKPTQAGILTHFRMIADSTDLPVILYDIPGRTGRADQVRDDAARREAPQHPGREGCEGRPQRGQSRAEPDRAALLRGRRRERAADPRDRRHGAHRRDREHRRRAVPHHGRRRERQRPRDGDRARTGRSSRSCAPP